MSNNTISKEEVVLSCVCVCAYCNKKRKKYHQQGKSSAILCVNVCTYVWVCNAHWWLRDSIQIWISDPNWNAHGQLTDGIEIWIKRQKTNFRHKKHQKIRKNEFIWTTSVRRPWAFQFRSEIKIRMTSVCHPWAFQFGSFCFGCVHMCLGVWVSQ